jgi:hypothetical protein
MAEVLTQSKQARTSKEYLIVLAHSVQAGDTESRDYRIHEYYRDSRTPAMSWESATGYSADIASEVWHGYRRGDGRDLYYCRGNYPERSQVQYRDCGCCAEVLDIAGDN